MRGEEGAAERASKATATMPAASPLPQDETTGVAAFFGTWPGDESDEELLDALEETRRVREPDTEEDVPCS